MVALLRGVNVGGITVTSGALATMFAEEGFENVRTVLASGNVAFDAPQGDEDAEGLKARIESALQQTFGYDAWIVLLARQRLDRIADAYPFPRTDKTDQPYVVFSSSPDIADELMAAAPGLLLDVEALAAGDGVLYWRVPKGSTLHTPFAKLLAKPRYQPYVTTRNLRTVEKLAKA
jgi:uncharacterized protein (DUF1697 family)